MDAFVPDAKHINALPEPVRRYIHELAPRADPAGVVAELALVKENNRALWKRVQELEEDVKRLTASGHAKASDLAAELQKVYDSEINLTINWFWDDGFNVLLGDQMNGFLAEENFTAAAEIVPWLREAIAHFYPNSTYAASLEPELLKRASTQVFRTPRVGARAVCPHCGTPHLSPMMDELFAFVCTHCGASVMLDPPKVQ